MPKKTPAQKLHYDLYPPRQESGLSVPLSFYSGAHPTFPVGEAMEEKEKAGSLPSGKHSAQMRWWSFLTFKNSFELRSDVASAGLEYTVFLRITLNFRSSHPCLPSTGFAGVRHHPWLTRCRELHPSHLRMPGKHYQLSYLALCCQLLDVSPHPPALSHCL